MKTNIKDFFNEKKWELGEQLYDNKRVSSPSTAPDYSSIFLVQDGCQICKVSISNELFMQ